MVFTAKDLSDVATYQYFILIRRLIPLKIAVFCILPIAPYSLVPLPVRLPLITDEFVVYSNVLINQ